MSVSIRLKHSAVQDRAPQPADLANGELALNINADSPALYLKDSAGNVIKVAGVTGSATAPTSPATGTVWIDSSQTPNVINVWDGTAWVPQAGATVASGTAPTAPVTGQIWVNTGVSPEVTQIWNGTGWITLDASGSDAQAISNDAKYATKAELAAEDLWDRTGTVVSPTNAGDDISTTGKVLVGTSTDITATPSSVFQGVHASGGALNLARNNTSVSTGNTLGRLRFWSNAASGTYEECATINVAADGSHATGDHPTRIELRTAPSGGGTPQTRATIDASGVFTLGDGTTNAVTLDPGTTGSPLVRDSSGRIGVGNPNPTAQLMVGGNPNGSTLTSGGGALSLARNGDTFLEFWTSGSSQSSKILYNQSGTEVGNIEYKSDTLRFNVNQAERARISGNGVFTLGDGTTNAVSLDPGTTGSPLVRDSAGRLLVGTASSSNTAKLVVQGGATAGNNFGPLLLSRSETNPTANNALGSVAFGDAAHSVGAQILSHTDSNWAAGSRPTRLSFWTAPSGSTTPVERMRIRENGRLITAFAIGGESSSATTSAVLTVGSATATGGVGWESYTTSTAARYHAAFSVSGTVVGSISTSGSATAFNTSSDYRLKENIAPVTDAVARLQKLKPCRFNFISDPDKTVDGFIAHEAQEVIPECVTGEKDAVDDEGNPVYQGIDQSKLVPLLTAALQEAMQRIEDLEAKVSALEGGSPTKSSDPGSKTRR